MPFDLKTVLCYLTGTLNFIVTKCSTEQFKNQESVNQFVDIEMLVGGGFTFTSPI